MRGRGPLFVIRLSKRPANSVSGAVLLVVGMLLVGCGSPTSIGAWVSAHAACPRVDYFQPVWSPDGTQIALIVQQYVPGLLPSFELFTMSENGAGIQLLYTDRTLSSVSWSPGTRLLFSTSSGLHDIRSDGSDLHAFPIDNTSGAAWAPAETAMALTIPAEAGPNIYLADSDGSHLAELGAGYAPVWSPDKTRILFSDYDRQGHPQILIMDANGSHKTQLTDRPADSGPADWSPDGQRIAFVSNASGFANDLFIMRADGSQLTQLTNLGKVSSGPSWSPAGDKIVFVSEHSGRSEIYTINPDGSDLTQLTHNPSGGICLH